MRVLVTRPLPGGAATAKRLQAMGHEVLLTPLLELEAVDWQRPADRPQAVMVTSAAAVNLSGNVADFRALPVYAVGATTAAAARAAGYADVRTGGAGVQVLVEMMARDGVTTALHLAGEDRTAVQFPPALSLMVRTVYRARLLPLTMLPAVDWVLLYSARSAGHFGSELDRLGLARSKVSVAAISAATLAAAGTGWQRAAVAAEPDEDALLAAIGAAWQKPDSNL